MDFESRWMAGRAWALGAGLWLSAVAAALAPNAAQGATPATAAQPAEGPSLATLKNTTYRGIDGHKRALRLSEGRWVGKPAAPGSATTPQLELVNDYVARGDLDGDGRDEAVVVLAHSPGGSGTFHYLAVVGQRKGRAVNVATTLLGDRVQVRAVRVVDRRLLVDLVQAGPEDPACCPGQTAQRAWLLKGGVLQRARSPQTPGRLSITDIGTSEWALTHWDRSEPLASGPSPTLAVNDGRLTGFAGCNRFFAEAAAGGSPGEVEVKPPGTTRRACEEAEMATETRFTQLLSRVRRFSFMPGALLLDYQLPDGNVGTMQWRQP